MPALNAFAKEKLAELESSSCAPKVAAEILRLLAAGSDVDCYKINVFRIAADIGASRLETLRGFLFATRLGLFDLHYDIHCPSCYGLPEFYKHLLGLRRREHCLMCDIDIDVDFEKQVEVTFTPNPAARKVRFRHFKERDFAGRRAYYREIVAREGRMQVIGDCLDPGETRALSGELEAGRYHMGVPSYVEKRVPLLARGSRSRQRQVIRVTVHKDGSLTPERTEARPGLVDFVVTYNYPRFWGFGVIADKPLKNWVSAAYVTSQQDFRDLFGGDFLAPDVSFAIRNVTLMFTDIKASTRMYEALGDSRAYAVVQDHFRVMTEAIRRFEGGIVKTIGDAVMASFPASPDAVKAACEVQRAFKGRVIKGTRVEVKIGIHRGPSIAVTSNRSLDYFGQTVNVAARAQGESRAGEVVLTESVLAEPAVGALLNSRRLSPRRFTAALKGVGGRTPLFRLQP